MLRFKPDDWLEGLLRPFILVDPQGFTYYELPAPDLRFAAVLLMTGIVLVSGRLRARLSVPAWRTLIALWLIFYIWTFFSGNGRYFMSGLLLAGPVLVLLVGRLPFTRSMRLLLLAGLVGLQAMLVHQHFSHGMWALAFWRDGPGLALEDSPIKHQPAVFVTISSVSHSALVPQFHPGSRWANVTGQVDIMPGMPEYVPLRRLLAAPLPRYLVLQILETVKDSSAQPEGEVLDMVNETLTRHGLQRDERPCQILQSNLETLHGKGVAPRLAYWFCPLREGPPAEPVLPPEAYAWNDVFDAVEKRCPRFFPPGEGELRIVGDLALRSYLSADTRLFVNESGQVLFRHLRALNATVIGSVDQVRRGDFQLDCHKLPGRYMYPWQQH